MAQFFGTSQIAVRAFELASIRPALLPVLVVSLALVFVSVLAAHANENTAKPEVDMLLCMAADVSESVTPSDYELQKRGHADA
ncbi:MAG: hypothetical protein AAF035_13885, partial [Pseudomonadota bacterium]